jgi:hypothetical protein
VTADTLAVIDDEAVPSQSASFEALGEQSTTPAPARGRLIMRELGSLVPTTPSRGG